MKAEDDDAPDEEHGPLPGRLGPYLEVEELGVREWCPTPDGSGPPLQVWVTLKLKGVEEELLIRFKSARTIGRFINSLRKHRDNVWPPG